MPRFGIAIRHKIGKPQCVQVLVAQASRLCRPRLNGHSRFGSPPIMKFLVGGSRTAPTPGFSRQTFMAAGLVTPVHEKVPTVVKRAVPL